MLSSEKIQTLDPKLVVEPFGKINYWHLPNDGKRLKVSILMEAGRKENARAGVAIDGSSSMKGPFGKLLLGQPPEQIIEDYKKQGKVRDTQKDGRKYITWSKQVVDELVTRGIFRYSDNIIEQQARDMITYLTKFDAKGSPVVIYWATGDGRQIEEIGELPKERCLTYNFDGPEHYGQGTHLLPAVRYFVEKFGDAEWGMYVFITDGYLDDLNEVKAYCLNLARAVDQKKRNDLKLVLIGVGDEIDERQMEELDDLETGTEVDLWDHKIAKEMKHLADIFAEVVDEQAVVAPNNGIIKDVNGNVIKDYRDSGLPALISFDLPPNSQSFTLELGGQVITQSLAESE